jgi:hypothetical protein
VVAAVKARTEIFDSIIRRGQEFGIIEKIADKKQIIGGVLVANMDNPMLRQLLQKELQNMAQTQVRYGEMDILGGDANPSRVIESGPDPNEYVPPSPPEFNQNLKPAMATGGLSKAAGGNATAKRGPGRPPVGASVPKVKDPARVASGKASWDARVATGRNGACPVKPNPKPKK